VTSFSLTEQAHRFVRDLSALADASGMLGVAVSGGPDSLALLLLTAAALPGRVRAATVDHGLRSESTDEARYVASICADLGITHETLAVVIGERPHGLQAAARDARYRALAEWAGRSGLASVATAHHADDQAETLLMRLQRGSGLGGLAGIRAVRSQSNIPIVRPLLGWTKAELVRIVAEAGIEAIDDPSNRDVRFDRTAARRLLANHPELDPMSFARSAAALAEAEQALAWSVENLAQARITRSDDSLILDPDDLPPEIKRRLVSRILCSFALAQPPRGEEIGRLVAALERRETATLSGVKCCGGKRWQFTPAPPRRR
jgi:tRNA(Ile)-lysidine synthase